MSATRSIGRISRGCGRSAGRAGIGSRPGDESWAARPLDPIDFEVRPGIRYSGWPFDRTHLDPYYVQAQEVCRLGPFDYDPGRWADQERTPPLPLLPGAVETTLFQHGTADFDGYYQELVRAPNVTLVLHASVVDLATEGDPGWVDRVELRREDGSRCFVRARLVVAGRRRDRKPAPAAAQPPVPPQRARQRPRPGRAVLRRADVGPHRVHHPGVPRADRPRRLVRRSRSPRPGYWCRERCGSATPYSGNGSSSTARSSSLPRNLSMMAEAVRSVATLAKARRRRPLPAGMAGHLGNVATGLGDLGVFARDRLRRPDEARGVLALRAQGEQAPNPDSRVTLGTRRDRFGLPVARVDWRPAASDRASIRATQEAIDEAFRGAGLGHVELMLGDEHPPALLEGNFHHLGATRMHTDPVWGWSTPTAGCTASGTSTSRAARCSRPTDAPTRRSRWWRWPCGWPTT